MLKLSYPILSYSENPANFFHTMGVGAGGNTKWFKGNNEGIYGADGIRRDDALNGSTYNIGGNDFIRHFGLDMLPYYWLGKNPDDPTTMGQRFWRSFNLPVYSGAVPPSNSCACEENTPLQLRGMYN